MENLHSIAEIKASSRADLRAGPPTIHWNEVRPGCASPTFHRRHEAAPGATRAHFEKLAAKTLHLTHRAEDIFGVLLVGTCPPLARDGWTFLPLWNEEAMHRAYRMLQLLLRLQAQQQDGAYDWRAEYVLAMHLAADFRSLLATAESLPVACSVLLRSVVRNIIALFGPAAGDIELKTSIQRISLPGYRRRALVLAASELVVNALSHAFAGRADGRIDVCLQSLDESRACLRVIDNGTGAFEGNIDTSTSLAGRLGRIFGGCLTYPRDRAEVTTAEIVFPLRL